MRKIPLSALAAALLFPLAADAQGTYSSFGTGCKGTGIGGPGCVSQNWNQPFSGNIAASANFAVLVNSGTTTRVICGFQFYCKTRSGQPGTTNVWIYDRSTTGQPGNILWTGTMNIAGTAQVNTATVNPPVIINPNTDFFLVIDNRIGLNMPISSAGTNGTHYWNGPPTWNGPFTTVRWNYNILCCGGGGAIPQLTNQGVPTINTSFSVDLAQAKAQAVAILATGAIKLNIDLTAAGAPGCTLLSSLDLILPVPTDASGNASVKIPVPNDRLLIGIKFVQQYVIIDSGANNLGLAFSNGGEGQIG